MDYKFLSLAILVLAPILPMLLIMCPLFPNNAVVVRRFAKGFASLHFAYSLLFLLFFNPDILSMSFPQEIFIFKSSWIQTMGISASFAVDGLSLLLCVLTSFIFLIALIVSKYAITSKHKIYYSLIMLLQTSVLGVFCSRDIFMFFMFWLLELLPIYFLIYLWGKENAQKAATKFILYNAFGSIFLLFGFLILYHYSFTVSGVLTGHIDSLSFDEYINPIWFQIVTFVCLFIGFAVKIPLIPLHGWYIPAQSSSPMPVNIIIGATTLSMGAYGFIKFNMQMFPTAFKELAVIIMFLAIINIFTGALAGFVRKNIKDVIGYLYISLSGFVLFGLTTVTQIGLTGAIFQIFACSLIFSALYMITGFIYLRTKTYEIEELGGIGRVMPKLMYFSVPLCLAAAGTPFFMVFPSELMVVIGAFTTELFEQITFQLVSISAIFSLLTISACILRFLHKVFFGNILSQFGKIKDISMSEFTSLTFIVIPVILFGVAPMLLINFYNNAVSIIMDILRT